MKQMLRPASNVSACKQTKRYQKQIVYLPNLFYILTLTGFFLLFEISYFVQCNKAYLSDFSFIASNLNIPFSILPGALFYIFAQLLVHIGYSLLICLITFGLINFKINVKSNLWLGCIIWLLGILTILNANQYYFPNSKFAELTGIFLFNTFILKFSLILFMVVSSVVLLIAALGWINYFLTQHSILVSCSLALAIIGLGNYFLIPAIEIKDGSTSNQPNIIIIGVDSLRPDFLSFFGSKTQTPFIDSFLKNATVFKEAYTPLARTFPSWMSILTGDYPKNHGARFNLASPHNLKLENTLAAKLSKQGYKTLYATDETRFSNIDRGFGFEQIISPPQGLNDFLLGSFNDFPLSNFLVNTSLGKWLFPYSYANRPAFFNYDPDSFLALIKPTLMANRSQPNFLAIHFCLPHFPYLWGSIRGNDYTILERYGKSINRVDTQLNDFFLMLEQYQWFKHAVVILLSDHGEALELSGDRITNKENYLLEPSKIPNFYPPSLDNEALDQSAGHGTDVLGLPQYHSLLSFRFYGIGEQKKGIELTKVTLLDVKPTILNILQLDNKDSDGISLLPILQGKSFSGPRYLFLESDFSPAAIRTVYPEIRQVVLEGVQLFEIDPINTRLTVKAKMAQMIIDSKQYANIYGDWMLALYPQSKQTYQPILINLKTAKWTTDLNSAFALQSPAHDMLTQLQDFYGKELLKRDNNENIVKGTSYQTSK